MRIAVCGGDGQELLRIRHLITEYGMSREEAIDCRYFTNSTDFLYELRSGEYDLVILDILMPGEGGIGTAQELRELDKNVRLIFVSTSSEFAVESYSVEAYYYLLKPVDRVTLFALLDRIKGELSVQAEQGFILKNRGRVVWIDFARLAYVEVINKTVFFHLADGAVHKTTAALTEFEEKLLVRQEFLKIHRSYLVNLSYIQTIDIHCVMMKNGHSIPVSRKRRSQVRDAYTHFLNQVETETPIPAAAKRERPEGPWQILLVDDDPEERAVWTDILQDHGCIVQQTDNGEDALRLAADNSFDCVLLDVMIPGEDGFSICERIHKLMDTPIIFLSCVAEADKQVEGFAAGGVDYITKDTPAELFWAKVETRIRLAMSKRTQRRFGSLLLDLTRHRGMIDGKELSLTSMEFDLLCCLAENAEHIFTPEELYGMVWGGQPWDGGQLVQMHMSRLRRKLEKVWGEHHFIETVWGQGYRFVPDCVR